ncbi:MAG: DUF3972 domain-containing protein [Helicobacter sp.]|nr:DUF3972 domain-containing protein [Helicobacter sp.]
MKISLEDFCALCSIDSSLMPKDALLYDQKSDEGFLSAEGAISIFLQKIDQDLVDFEMQGQKIDPMFLEKTLKIMRTLYEKIIHSIEAQVTQAKLLEDTFLSLQDEMTNLKDELKSLKNLLLQKDKEIEFLRRKHELMWGKINSLDPT